ncbi:MAG: HAMP domain-containing histidine kinase [Bacteroidaceae bacterium]|nr:HAMP domain-containing histidine kinase [Bacteroidaceae bacterium]
MRLIYRVTLRIAIVLLPVLLLWAIIFYHAMVNEINDETDDSLEDYAELIVRRVLTGQELPSSGDGTNNTYNIELITGSSVQTPSMYFEDRKVYIPEKSETEPARVLTLVFPDSNGQLYKLAVSMPTFEREDLMLAMLWHIIGIYAVLLLTILVVTALIFHYSMRPLYALLRWLDRYRPGKGVENLPADNRVIEFKKLTDVARSTIERAESYMERQKQFIGNASHELQTPIAVLGTRIEWIIDNTPLTEEQFAELSKMRQSLHRLNRLNRTLLLISKIDNAQFTDRSDVDIVDIIKREAEIYSDIYCDKQIECMIELPERFIVPMDDSLAATMITNLIKNAYIHSPENALIKIYMKNKSLFIDNSGNGTLDKDRIFDRFYTSGKNGSTGLGLALVKSIADSYRFGLTYSFTDNMHRFEIKF